MRPPNPGVRRGGPSRALLGLAITALLIGFSPAAWAQADPPVGTECGTENLVAGAKPSEKSGVQGDPALVTDGAASPEGAPWDAPTTVLLGARGALTYDLVTPRSIGALFVQADANDTYRVQGSLDGSPGSFRPLFEIPNVIDRGHGLQNRAVRFPPVTARFVRIGDAVGDGSFSVAEFSVYCRAPAPFPAVLRVVGEKAAPKTSRATRSAEPEPSGAPRLLFLVAAGLALLGLTQIGKPRGSKQAALPETERPASAHDHLRLLFVASGAAALIYEVVWLHLLRLVIGASAMSVAIVLASFMGGMFLGSLFFSRVVPKHHDPLRVYALLEIGIGVLGLLMPLVLPAVRFVYVGLVGYGAFGIALRGLIAALLLLPPTALMGATLPAIARRYSGTRRGAAGLASLYAANTFGAVLGSLLAAFYLLAVWDVWVATFAAVVLNFAVGAYALRLSRTKADAPATAPARPAEPPRPGSDGAARLVYFAAALSGLTALGAQVVWTRLLTLLFGATVYAFAIILAVFLFGLGLGSALSAYLLRRGLAPLRGLAWTQMALVPALLLSAYLLAGALPYASPPGWIPVRALHTLHVLRAVDVVLPSAVLWGMSFPLALAAAGTGESDTGRTSGYVYAANTIGAIVGALGVSFWIVPSFGTKVAGQCLVGVSAVCAAVLFRDLRRGPTAASALPPALALAAGAACAALLPGLSQAFLAHGRYIWWVDPRDQYLYVSEGAASTVAVHVAPDGYRNFHVAGRVEATDNPADLRLERLLGHLSALAHPRPESVLVVGLGAGVTAGSLTLHPEVKRVVICEIEPRVAGAAALFDDENYGVLSSPKVEVVFDDARHFLATTRERFDVITSDPIHPWVRGNSVLFSREYYAIVASKLKPGGIATQWVPLYETSEKAIQIQMRTFVDAFRDATVWNSAVSGRGYDVVLLGRAEPRPLDLGEIQARIDRSPVIGESLREVRITSAADLVATYATRGADMQRWLEGIPVNRDFSLKLEYISGLALNSGEADPIYAHMVAGRGWPDGLFVAPPQVENDLRERLGLALNSRTRTPR